MGIVDGLNDALNKGISGTERLLEVGKLKARVATLAKSRTDLLAALGSIAYDQFRTSKASVEAFTPIGERIRGVEVEIAQAQARLEELERAPAAIATVTCSACGHANVAGGKFCVKCGGGLEQPDKKRACASCGAALPDESKFCVRCGTPAPPAKDS